MKNTLEGIHSRSHDVDEGISNQENSGNHQIGRAKQKQKQKTKLKRMKIAYIIGTTSRILLTFPSYRAQKRRERKGQKTYLKK